MLPPDPKHTGQIAGVPILVCNVEVGFIYFSSVIASAL